MSASIMMSSSIRLSFTGELVDWTTNTSEPRTVSKMDTKFSPSEKAPVSALPKGMLSSLQMSLARALLELPAKIFRSLPCEIMLPIFLSFDRNDSFSTTYINFPSRAGSSLP